MARRCLRRERLAGAFRAAVANLEAHVDEINGLNVYPVPDGDTGSNMLATVKAALDEAEAVAGQPADRIAAAISFGALMGARGNSGVITSQIFRGMAEGLGGKRRFNGLDLAHALSEGARTAYGAVAKPVEGTILTVIRESAAGAVETAEHDNDIEAVLGATLAAAERSVAKTPSLLAILREAGVVDAGGQGLYRLFQGALLHLLGQAPVTTGRRPRRRGSQAIDAGRPRRRGIRLRDDVPAPGRRATQPLDVDAIRDHLETIGESVLVAGDGRALKVHVHNERPDQVIGYGLGLGSMSRISVENLDNQARDVRETRAAAFTASAPTGHGAAPSARDRARAAGRDSRRPGTAPRHRPSPSSQSTAGDGLAAIFRDFGVAAVVQGGQSANPSTGELLEAVRAVDAREVLLLPNNPNVVLAARQVAQMTDRPVSVVPDPQRRRGLRRPAGARPADGRRGQRRADDRGRPGRSRAWSSRRRSATRRSGAARSSAARRSPSIPTTGWSPSTAIARSAVLAAMKALKPGSELVR